MTTFSKRHYETVASVLNDERIAHNLPEDVVVCRRLMTRFAAVFLADNRSFDPNKFYQACGFGDAPLRK